MAIRWESREYLTIIKVLAGKDKLIIEFANTDVVEIVFSALIPPHTRGLRWTDSYVSADHLHVIVPAEPEGIEIAWHVIRSLTDREFARHMAMRASKQAGYVGARLRELRNQRGLTQARVADAAGIEPANLSRIENGKFDVSTSTLWKILAAMGYSPADLARREVKAAADMEWAVS